MESLEKVNNIIKNNSELIYNKKNLKAEKKHRRKLSMFICTNNIRKVRKASRNIRKDFFEKIFFFILVPESSILRNIKKLFFLRKCKKFFLGEFFFYFYISLLLWMSANV